MRNVNFLIMLALSFTTGVSATTVDSYNNTTTDTTNKLLYSAGPYDGLGDTITLSGLGLPLDDAFVQFYNNSGTSGSFDAILTFYEVGSPVGPQIGSSFTLTGNTVGALSLVTLDFSLGGLTLPDNVVFILTVANVLAADLGLELYGPATIGSNTADSATVLSGATFSTISTGAGSGNSFLELTSATPEPTSWLMMGLGVIVLVFRMRYPYRDHHDGKTDTSRAC